MSEGIKYPYIGQGKYSGAVFLLVSEGAALTMQQGENSSYSTFEADIDEGNCKNITREYLQNTWSAVESKEHAEFIIEIAKNAGLKVWMPSNGADGMKSFAIERGELCLLPLSQEDLNIEGLEQITIPLPPRAKEWAPEVGELAVHDKDYANQAVEVVKHKQPVSGSRMTLVLDKNDHPYWVLTSALSKPKTEQDLKIEELQTKLCNLNAVDDYILASEIVMGNVEGLSYGSSDFNVKDSAHELWDENAGDFEDFLEIFIKNHNITKKN